VCTLPHSESVYYYPNSGHQTEGHCGLINYRVTVNQKKRTYWKCRWPYRLTHNGIPILCSPHKVGIPKELIPLTSERLAPIMARGLVGFEVYLSPIITTGSRGPYPINPRSGRGTSHWTSLRCSPPLVTVAVGLLPLDPGSRNSGNEGTSTLHWKYSGSHRQARVVLQAT